MDYKVIHNTSEAFPYAGAIEIPAGHAVKLLKNEADHILNTYDFFVELTGEEYDKLAFHSPELLVNFLAGPAVEETTPIVDAQEVEEETEATTTTEAVADSVVVADPDAVEEPVVKTDEATEVKTEEVKTEDKPKRGK